MCYLMIIDKIIFRKKCFIDYSNIKILYLQTLTIKLLERPRIKQQLKMISFALCSIPSLNIFTNVPYVLSF